MPLTKRGMLIRGMKLKFLNQINFMGTGAIEKFNQDAMQMIGQRKKR